MKSLHALAGAVLLICACASANPVVAGIPELRSATSQSESGTVPAKEPCFGVALPDSITPVQYAAGKAWYTSHAPLPMFGDRYVKFGMPRTAESLASEQRPPDLTYARMYDGVPVYAERGTMPMPRFIYIPLSTDCQFQEYAQERELQ